MLTKRQNLMETIRGGNPDRFVKQYEFMNMIAEAAFFMLGIPHEPGQTHRAGHPSGPAQPRGRTHLRGTHR